MAARNVEIKAYAPDLTAIRHRASAIAAAPPQLISQIDTFFLVQHGRLKVREFDDGSGELIAYDRADREGPRTSNYTVVSCDGAGALCEALSRVLLVRGRVVKRRELFLIGRTRVHLDEVEGLGTFVELEVVLDDGEAATDGEAEARELMRRLGIGSDALIPKAYIDLLEESRHG